MNVRPLNMYMGYSRSAGASEGAVLVFSKTVQEARIMTYKNGLVADEYIDTAARRMQEKPYLRELNKSNVPCVIESPPGCRVCHQWGDTLDDDGICESCRDEMEDSQ